MTGGEAILIFCRIDSSSGIVDQSLVLEILMKITLVGIQKTGSADLGQGNDVCIVGFT